MCSDAPVGSVIGDKKLDNALEEVSFWRKNRKYFLTGFSGFFWLLGFSLMYFELASWAIASFVLSIALGGIPILRNVLTSIKEFNFDMNVLMSLAVLGAGAIGEWAEGATVVFLFSVGNMLQSMTVNKTRDAIHSLMNLQVKEAVVRRNGREYVLAVEQIKLGDLIIVGPGQRIALDGKVVAGQSSVNQSPITGESMPVEKAPGEMVFAGTVNENGVLEIMVTRLEGDSTVARIIRMVSEAQAKKAPAQLFVDRFAKIYTPAVIVIAIGMAVLPPLFGADFQPWFYRSLELLVVSCPCALILSTPVSIVAAIGNAAKNGVLIKGGEYLEQAGKLDVLAFDKTGTLTEGKPVVTDFLNYSSYSDEQILAWAGALESSSSHPLAKAVMGFLQSLGVQPERAENVEALPGFGVKGNLLKGPMILAGPRWYADHSLDKQLIESIDNLQAQGKTVMLLSSGQEIMSLLAVADSLREESAVVIEGLKKLKLEKAILLTGDNEQTARSIGAKAGIDEIYANLLPEQKLEIINDCIRQGKTVGMIGDGINDAPALAAAHVGIAMGGAGTDVAMESADIVLMGDNLTKLPFAIQLSRKSLAVIKQNVAFALLVKGIALALILPNWLTLWLAVLSDTGAAVIVTLNSMRLLTGINKQKLE